MLMGQKQLQRWHLIKMVEGRKLTLREAGEKVGVCGRGPSQVFQGTGSRSRTVHAQSSVNGVLPLRVCPWFSCMINTNGSHQQV